MENRLVIERSKIVSFKNRHNKKSANKIVRKYIRNSKRRTRRKQTKLKYYKNLKKNRFQKTTEDLCSQVQVVDIDDMDWISNKDSKSLPTELVEWHKQDQIAYWKARAISLELENKMLKQHLRNMYSQAIEDASNMYQNIQAHEGESGVNKNTVKAKYNKSQSMEVIIANLPDRDIKNRLEEMRHIYGDTAEKIMGMETAIQLNYERHLEQDQPIFWPTIPLKLTFE